MRIWVRMWRGEERRGVLEEEEEEGRGKRRGICLLGVFGVVRERGALVRVDGGGGGYGWWCC